MTISQAQMQIIHPKKKKVDIQQNPKYSQNPNMIHQSAS